jgi:uncharacterized membrane protein (DUF106 family)
MWAFNSIFGKIFELMFLPFRGLSSPWWGMLVVSALTGLLMLLIFKLTSNQAGIRRTKDRIKAHLLEMRLYNESMRSQFKAMGGILKANLRYMSHSLKPLLVMFIPVILILIQLNFWFAYASLEPGEAVLLKVTLEESINPLETEIRLQPAPGLTIETPPLRIEEEGEVDWRISFTEAGVHNLDITVGSEHLSKTVAVSERPLSRLSPRRVKKRFWEELSYPTEPPLDETSAVSRIEVVYPTSGLPFLGWTMHWLIAFFLLSIIFGFALKGLFKVEI